MNIVTEPLFNSPLATWITQDDRRDDFAARIVRETALPADNIERLDFCQVWMSTRAHSHNISIKVQARSEYDSMASDNVPSLTRASSVASTHSATSTSMASVVDGGCMLESEDGVLVLPARLRPDADLLCPFRVLECHETFSEVIDFKVHVFSHFRGHELPPFAPCFVCGRPFFLRPGDDNALAWNQLLSHMAYEHYRSGQATLRLRPDMAIMRYMWNRGIISDAEFKRTQLESCETSRPGSDIGRSDTGHIPEVPMPPSAPTPPEISQHLGQSVNSSTEPFTVSAGRRQDRRQADPSRLRARVRGNL